MGLKTRNRCDKWQLRSIIIAAVRCSFAYAAETYNSHVMCGHVSYLLITYGSQKNGRPFFWRLSNLVMACVWADDLGKSLVKKNGEKIDDLGKVEQPPITDLSQVIRTEYIPMKNGYFIGNIPNIFRQTHFWKNPLYFFK